MDAAASVPLVLATLVGLVIGAYAPAAHAVTGFELAGAARVRSVNTEENPSAESDAADAQTARKRYVANLHALLERQIMPALRRGVVETAASRPRSLTIEVTEDPSPYNVGAKVESDGSLKVRLTLGYTTMHDAALDAVMLSAPLHQSKALRPYLTYQLLTARENYVHRSRAEPTRQAMTFAEFAGLDADVVRVVYAQPAWRASRDHIEIESLGWVVAYLLARADPKLGGSLSFPTSSEGAAAARLAAASDWFPVPPFATAFQWADVMRSSVRVWDARALLCRAALFMEGGVAAFKADPRWRARLQQEPTLESRIESIRSDIQDMRRDGACPSSAANNHDIA